MKQADNLFTKNVDEKWKDKIMEEVLTNWDNDLTVERVRLAISKAEEHKNKEIKGEVGKIDKQLKFIDKIVPEADNDR